MPQTLIPLQPNLGVLQIGIKSQGYREPVMSDSEDSTVTYTAVSSPFGGSLTGPPSPDYIPGPEEPQSPPPPDFVPEPVYPEFMPPEDEILPAEEQPLPAADSPTADSPGYVPESDPEERLPEEDDDDPESILARLLADRSLREAARQLLEQAPLPSEYVPDPMELEDHVPVYIPEPEHLEDLVPAKDEAPIEPYIIEKRLLLTAPTPRVEVGESSAATARQPGSTMGRRVDHSFVDTVDTKIRDTERRTMAAIEVVNLRVSYQADVRKRESLRFYSRHQEAQEDRAAVRAEIEILRREACLQAREHRDPLGLG
ncbi:hypothetical protein Tco_1540048 [Tanacetum coccineum]